jgi:hypothetical protein
MDLVSGVKLASMQTTSQDIISSYKFYMYWYLTTLLELYLGMSVTLNQHLSLHFDISLEGFGLIHSFQTFGFEQGNYLL